MERFRERFPDWVRQFPTDDAVYDIPGAVATQLRRSGFFDQQAVAAEREFADLCAEQGIVGMWRECPIDYPLLRSPPLRVDGQLARQLGWTDAQLAGLDEAAPRVEAMHDRLRGVVGWLLTEPAFAEAVRALRQCYEAVPGPSRPDFPLRRLLPLADQGTTPPSEPVTAFVATLARFLSRWGIRFLATWDLPDPQGPFLPDSLPPSSVAQPVEGIRVLVPLHYPLQGDDDLLRLVRDQQRRRVAELELPRGFAGVGHHTQDARMFRVIHLERAIRSRIPGRPRGLASAIEASIGSELGLDADSVRRLRKWVGQCRNGRRQRIPRLRDRG